MFKRELKYNLKSFIIWMLLLIGTYLIIFLLYPLIVNSDSIKSLEEMMNMFPKEILQVFNMDIASILTAYGWLKSEGFIFILLIIGCYGGILGSNIILKEESEKTIEYLNSLPIKRSKMVLSKVLVGLIYITLMVLLLGIFNYIGLSINEEINSKEFILLSITPLFSGVVIYSVCLFISSFAHKTKKVLGISLGFVFVGYIFNALSEISESVEFLKYFSVYTLSDVRNVLLSTSLNIYIVLISIAITILFIVLTLIRYQNKNLI